jgi:integrase
MKPDLIIIRGIPGSGKTTYAALKYPTYYCVSSDDYFYYNGKYNYDSNKLSDAHDYCFLKVKSLLEKKHNCVVTNTFVTKTELLRYINYFDKYAKIKVIRMMNIFQNVHNVPDDKIQYFKDSFYDYDQETKIISKFDKSLTGKDNYLNILKEKYQNKKTENENKILISGVSLPSSKYIQTEISYDKTVSSSESCTLLEKSTIKCYESKIKKLNDIGITIDNNLDIEEIIIRLNEDRKKVNNSIGYSYSAIMGFIAAIINEIKKNADLNQFLLNTLDNKMQYYKLKCDEQREQKLSTPNEQTIEWNEILKLHVTLGQKKNKTFKELTNYAILSLYCMMPPRRNDYANMKIIKNIAEANNLEHNYFVTEDRLFIFNKYKTSKKKDRNNKEVCTNTSQHLSISDDLYNILDEYTKHQQNKLTQQGSLFSNVKFINRSLTEILKTINSKVTQPINTIRHSFATFMDKNITDIDDKIELTKQMAHSVDTNLTYYVNLN